MENHTILDRIRKVLAARLPNEAFQIILNSDSRSVPRNWVRLSGIDRVRKLHLRLCNMLSELCSFRHRMYIATQNSELFRVPTGFVFLESPGGASYLNTRSLGRSEHIQTVSTTYPWATPLDWKLHCESWDSGVEWAIHNLGCGSSLADEHKRLLISELSYRGPSQV